MMNPCRSQISQRAIKVERSVKLTRQLSCRTLSSHALAALAEFNAEKDAHRQQYENLRVEDDSDGDGDDKPLSMAAFTEDWNESQFWVRNQNFAAKTVGCRSRPDQRDRDHAIPITYSVPTRFLQMTDIWVLLVVFRRNGLDLGGSVA